MTVDYSELLADLPRLLRIARGLGLSHHDAEDLVQAAVLRTLPRWNQINSNPRPYLRTVLTNLFLDQLRHGKVLSENPVGLFDDDSQQATVNDRFNQTALRIDIERALATLTPLARTVLILRFLDGQTIASTATILRKPAGTIARVSSEAIAALREATILSSPGEKEF